MGVPLVRIVVLLWLVAFSHSLFSASKAVGGTSIMKAPPISAAVTLLPAFYVKSTSPTSGTVGYGQSYVTATFNKAVSASTVNKTTFKLKCGSKTITNANVVMVNETAAVFWGTEFFDKNTSCQATLTTGIKSASGESLSKDYMWTFNTEPRDECLLNECSKFYGSIVTLDQDPNAQKHLYIMEGGGSITCMVVPKDVYGEEIYPHLMGCIPTISQEGGGLLLQYQDWVEGVQNCPVPTGTEAWGKEDFWWSDDPDYIASVNDAGPWKGDEALETQNVVLFCYSPSSLKEWRDACGNNTCGKRTRAEAIRAVRR